MATKKLFVNGRWIVGSGPRTTIINPATEDPLAEVSEAVISQADEAVGAARTAFDSGPWPRLLPKERAAVLRRVADILLRRKEELIDLVVAEVGTPRLFADMIQVSLPLQQFGWWADQAEIFAFSEPLRPVPGMAGGGEGAVFKEPVGVVAAMTPFNAPLMLNLWKVGAALAVGNTVVLKPSPYTPLTALVLAEAFEEAELPEGVLNVIAGGAEVGERLTTHPGVDLVSFTGSETIGRRIYAQAASSLKRVVLELGGKSANIVFAEVDLDQVLFPSVLGFTLLCGQGCGLTTRMLVQRPLYEEFIERTRETMTTFRVGDPGDASVMIGPLIRESQRQRVENYVAAGQAEGARLVTGGARPAGLDRGFFFQPTLFADVDNRMAIAQEEIFGPVGVVIPFDDVQDAVRIANDSPYGLTGSVWHPDQQAAIDVAGRIRTGFMTVNGAGGVLSHPEAPFGGYKSSGIGRECGPYGLLEYLELKTVLWPTP